MPIEDADELAAFFDADEFGTTALWTDASGRAVGVDGILLRGGLTVGLGPIGGEGTETVFRAPAIGVLGVAQKDTLRLAIAGVDTTATIVNVRPRDDGTVDLVLRV